MNRDRLLALSILGGIVVVALLGWFVGVSPILTQAAAADDDRAGVTSINDINAVKLVALKKQFDNIAETQSKLDALRTSIPSAPDIPALLRTVQAYGDADGITLTSVTVSGVTAYVAPTVATPTAAAGATTSTATPAPSPSASASTTAPAVVPAVPKSNLFVVPITISVAGTYDQVMAFAGAIQNGPRLFLVSTLTLASTEGAFTGDITGDVYALPAPVAVAAATK